MSSEFRLNTSSHSGLMNWRGLKSLVLTYIVYGVFVTSHDEALSTLSQ